jgi:hypothetical protein
VPPRVGREAGHVHLPGPGSCHPVRYAVSLEIRPFRFYKVRVMS